MSNNIPNATPTGLHGPPLQTQAELATAFYSAYETVLAQYLAENGNDSQSRVEDLQPWELGILREDDLSLDESVDEDNDSTSSSCLSDREEDDEEINYNRTIRHLFPGASNISGVVEFPELTNLVPKISMHAVNTLGIIKRYLPEEETSYKSCQYMPRREEPFDFGNVSQARPLDDLNPNDFDCRTKLIVIVKDKRCKFWGSHWSTLLIESLNQRGITSTCFTLRSQTCTSHLQTMLDSLGPAFTARLNASLRGQAGSCGGNTGVEKFVTMSALAKIFQFWSVPLLIIDYAPKRILDYKSILTFAERANIKVISFGLSKKSIGSDIVIEAAIQTCRAKAETISRIIGNLYEQEFRDKMAEGHYSMQSVRCVQNLDQVCAEVTASRSRFIVEGKFRGSREVREESMSNLSRPNPPLPYASINNVAISNAYSDWNEWLEWEQPYYDNKEKRRQQARLNKIGNGQDNENESEQSPGPGESGEGDEPKGVQIRFLDLDKEGPEASPIFHQILHGDVEMPQLVLSDKSERPNTLKIGTSSDSSSTESASSEYNSSESETDTAAGISSRRKHVKNPFRPVKKRWPTIYEQQKIYPEDLRLPVADYHSKPGPGEETPVSESESKLSPEEIEGLKELQAETQKYSELERLRKYFQKMKRDYKNMLQGKEPDSYKDFSLVDKFNEGKSSCLEMKEDEWALMSRPMQEVLSPYDVQYLTRDFTEHHAQFKTNMLKATMVDATSLFIDTIIQVCSGCRLLPGPKESRKTIKTVIFIHDNSDVLELLTAALWFAGKTAVASCSRGNYDQHRYFGASLTACKSYATKDLREEELYLTWITIGLNQVLKQDDIRFVIVDFPRPGKPLNKVFKAMLDKLQTEKSIRGIETLYVSQCTWRGDNLATVENVLDQLQDRMDAVERIVFRKSRAMYLNFGLCRAFEAEVKEELNCEESWGLPPPEMMTPELWESIKLHELQMCSKKSARRSLRQDQENDLRHLATSLGQGTTSSNLATETVNDLNADMSTSGTDAPSPPENNAISHPTNYDDNGNYTEEEQNSSSESEGDEEALQLLEDTARLRQELDDLEEMEISLRDSDAVRQLYHEWMTESERSIPSFSPETLTLLQNVQDREAMARASNSRHRTPSGPCSDPSFRDNSEQYNRINCRNINCLLETLHEHEDEDFEDRFEEELFDPQPEPSVSEVLEEMICSVVEAVEGGDYSPKGEDVQRNIADLQDLEEVAMVEEIQINVSSPLCRPTDLEIQLTEDDRQMEGVGTISASESVSIEELQQSPGLTNTLEEVTSYLLSFDDGTSDAEIGMDFDDTLVEFQDEAQLPDDAQEDICVITQDNGSSDAGFPLQNLLDTSAEDDVVEMLNTIFSCITKHGTSDDDETTELVLIEECEEPQLPEIPPSEDDSYPYSLMNSSESESKDSKESESEEESDGGSSTTEEESKTEEGTLSEQSDIKTDVPKSPKNLKVHFQLEPEHFHEISDDNDEHVEVEEAVKSKKKKKSKKKPKLTVSTNPQSDDYYDPDNYVETTDSDEDFVEKISHINYLIGDNPLVQSTRHCDCQSVSYVDDDVTESEGVSQGSNHSMKLVGVTKTRLFDKDLDRVVDYETETTSKSSESESNSGSSESDSDTEFRNLVDTPSANYVRTPRSPVENISTDKLKNGEISPSTDEDEEEDFLSGVGWSLPQPVTACEANDNSTNATLKITPDLLEDAILEPSLQNTKSLKMMRSPCRVSPESVILTGESSCVSGQCQISSSSPDSTKSSFQALGTFLTFPFRIMLNLFRKSDPSRKIN